ncbi:MAG: hypothetical protein JO153_05300 [Solirubrobacterales bacterium]|nr:hypothetical protein [Solirubrobacterales bacterium]MBV9915902.1 hypothetical protein [Solirubrobacterales bacterium]
MADPPASANGNKGDTAAELELIVGKATDAYKLWQQLPAWVLGAAAIIGAGFLIAFPRHLTDAQSRDAWAAVIVSLILAVVLSFRSAFTLNDDPAQRAPVASNDGPQAQPTPAAANGGPPAQPALTASAAASQR